MTKKLLIFLFLYTSAQFTVAQTILEADGSGNTYELINSILAPGYNVVEAPDCGHNNFGRHIDEVFDTELNKYVFRFHIHTSPDNDRCINFDRQRNEIKTYDKSPDSLLATLHEKVEYKWKFKLDSAFQPSSSFTHIHQIKAVGGSEASMPLITLTPRKSNPDKLQLRYASALSQSTIYDVALAPFKGVWVEATETILYNEVGLGQYEILITKISTGDTLFHFVDNSIRMWKTNADFLRPKWGVYRSLNNSTDLRDEVVLFADFSIEELDPTVSTMNYYSDDNEVLVYPNPADNQLLISKIALSKFNHINIYNANGKLVLTKEIESANISISHLKAGLYILELTGHNIKTKPIKIIVE